VVEEVVQKPAGRKASTKPERVDEVVKVPPGPNVRVEFTLTDQQTGVPTTNKTVMLTTSNRQWGRIRIPESPAGFTAAHRSTSTPGRP
jgi:hypothetical protein